MVHVLIVVSTSRYSKQEYAEPRVQNDCMSDIAIVERHGKF